jgi:beta-glucosidase
MRRLNDEINRLCQPLIDGKNVYLLDMAPAFLQPDGTLTKEIMPDLLHLNPASYTLWAEALQKRIKEIAK